MSATDRGKSSSTSSTTRRPIRGAEALVDPGDGFLDRLPVLGIAGHALARRVRTGDEHHSPAVLGKALEQVAVREEAPELVLGQLHAIDASDQESVADQLVEGCERALAGGGRRRLLEDRRGPTPAATRRWRATSRRGRGPRQGSRPPTGWCGSRTRGGLPCPSADRARQHRGAPPATPGERTECG